MKQKSCNTCQHGSRFYSDGYIQMNFEPYQGDVSLLPTEPDKTEFWTYQTCAFNKKELKHVNLMDDCKVYKERK